MSSFALFDLHSRSIIIPTLKIPFFRFGSVHGEELAYVLGMPLVGGTYHFVHNYTNQVKSFKIYRIYIFALGTFVVRACDEFLGKLCKDRLHIHHIS